MVAIGTVLLLVLLTLLQLFATREATDIPFPPRPRLVVDDDGLVAADHRICSDTGTEILKSGGNAVDSAVSTALCLGIVQPEASGIGGGDFLLLRLANGHARAYNMRETAPLQASESMYAKDPTQKYKGGLSVAVPGEVKGLYQVWKKYGTLPWKQLVKPAIRLANEGFAVEPYLASQIRAENASILADNGLREVFAPNGILLREGDICYRKTLGETLSAIAEQGSRAFYRGPIAKALAEDVQAAGGILTVEDLASYKVKVTAPIIAETWGHTLLGFPPPSSGGPGLALILNILAAFKSPLSAIKGDLGLHHIIEAFKHTYAVRTNLADPDFVNVTGVVADMISPAFAKALQSTIADNTTFPPDHYGGKYNPLNQGDDHGTSHVSIVDRYRNAVSMTCTVNYVFGSKFLSPKTGVLLNNEMDDFATPQDSPERGPPATVNFIKPGKRPLSTMTPTIILFNEQLRVVMGGSGGIKILTTVAQVLLDLIAGIDPITAMTIPRVHHQFLPNVVTYENYTSVRGQLEQVPEETRQFLTDRGHVLSSSSSGAVSQFIIQDLSKSVNISRDSPNRKKRKVFFGKLIGVSDLRKDGYPAGY